MCVCVGGEGGRAGERNNATHAIIRQPGQSSKNRTRQIEGFAGWGGGGGQREGWRRGGGERYNTSHAPIRLNHQENAKQERDYRWGGGQIYTHITIRVGGRGVRER